LLHPECIRDRNNTNFCATLLKLQLHLYKMFFEGKGVSIFLAVTLCHTCLLQVKPLWLLGCKGVTGVTLKLQKQVVWRALV
jgi:hypothetical protein